MDPTATAPTAPVRLATCGHGATQMRPGEAKVEIAVGRALAAVDLDAEVDAADGDSDQSHAGHGWRGRGRS